MSGFNHTLSAVLRGRWLINNQWALEHIPMVIGLINGKDWPARSNNIIRSGYEGSSPFAIDPRTGSTYRFTDYYGNENPEIPMNSVGVLPVTGPVTKYDGECGEPGSISFNNALLRFKRSSKINSVVLLADTPGGEARAANEVVNTIQTLGKPVLAYVDGMAASLGIWYTSACKEVYLSNEMDQMGSIGSYVTLFDFRGMLEMSGIKMHEIYAPQSTDKNKAYYDAIDGDYTLIKKDLEMHVDAFISFVKKGRGDKAIANESNWNTGKMFHAREAIANGLADGIMDFDRVVNKAAWLGLRNKNQ